MKISHSGQTTASARPRSARRAAAGRFGAPPAAIAAADHDGATSAATAAGAAQPVSSVDAVMALQAVDDARGRASRAGARLLDRLEDLRLALLGGGSIAAAAAALEHALPADGTAAADPELQNVLDAIKVRTAVELAKHQRSIT